MPVVEDKGNWRSQLNSKLANIIANVLGQRVNLHYPLLSSPWTSA